jgi:hypothetical protein
MITFNGIKNKPRIFKTFTGLMLAAFEALLPAFGEAYEQDLDKCNRQRSRPRQRRRGGGAKVHLSLDSRGYNLNRLYRSVTVS